MRNLVPLLIASTAPLWLAACAQGLTLSMPGIPADAPAEIQRQLAPLCPQPLTPDALRRAATYLEAHPDAAWLLERLDLFDRQTRICRGGA